MYKTLIFALGLLISAAWLQAQQANPPSDADKASGLTTLEGCLQKKQGQIVLTDSNNEWHQLSGAIKKLSPHVGHEVEVTGKPSVTTIDNTPPGGASSVIQQYVFEVKSVKQLADTCKTY